MSTTSAFFTALTSTCFVMGIGGCDSSGGTDPSEGTDESNTDSDAWNGTDAQDTGSDSGTSATVEEVLFPSAVGNYWTYRYEYRDASAQVTCLPGEWTARLLDSAVVDGVETFTYLNPCSITGDQSVFSLQFDGDEVVLVDYDTPYVMLDAPVTEDHQWTTALDVSEYTYAWQSVASVTVPAGTFDDCWKRVDVNSGQYLTYCRGVGRVQGGIDGVMSSDLLEYHLEAD